MIRFVFALLVVFTTLSTPAHAGWTPWVSLGGTITSDPAACTIGNYTYVVARGTDTRYYYRRRYLPTGIWDAWKLVGKAPFGFSGSPGVSCVQIQNKPTLIVGGIVSDGSLYIAYVNDGEWGGWGNIRGGNRVGTGPAISALSSPVQTHYFVRAGNTVYWRLDGAGDFQPLGGYVSADPASTHQSAGRLDLILRARDGRLRHAWWEGGIWFGLDPVGGGAVTSAADVVSRAPGVLDLFVKGQSNNLLHKRWVNGIWGGWTDLGGLITSGPGATVYANKQRMMVFARWNNGQLYYRAWAP